MVLDKKRSGIMKYSDPIIPLRMVREMGLEPTRH